MTELVRGQAHAHLRFDEIGDLFAEQRAHLVARAGPGKQVGRRRHLLQHRPNARQVRVEQSDRGAR